MRKPYQKVYSGLGTWIAAVRFAPRWLNIFGIAMLVLAVSAIQPVNGQLLEPPQVQEANVTYAIVISNAPDEICVGEVFILYVRIEAQIEAPMNSNAPAQEGAAVFTVTGTFLDATYDSAVLSGGGSSDPAGSFDISTPLQSTFQFTGVAAGSTTIHFSGDVQTFLYTYPVATDINVRVVACNYRVELLSRWDIRLPPTRTFAFAIIQDGHITRNAYGEFRGEAEVIFVTGAIIPLCGYVSTVVFGRATLSGVVDRNNELRLDLTFAPLSGDDVGAGTACHIANSGGNLRMEPLRVFLPLRGGSTNVWQRLTNPLVNSTGSGKVTITPEAP